jgi:hypothetical protein
MNCKPGDLAYVVRSRIPENIGMVIEIKRVCPHNGIGYWQYFVTKPTFGEYTDTGAIHLFPAGTTFSIGDERVRPISGVPVHDEVTDEVAA